MNGSHEPVSWDCWHRLNKSNFTNRSNSRHYRADNGHGGKAAKHPGHTASRGMIVDGPTCEICSSHLQTTAFDCVGDAIRPCLWRIQPRQINIAATLRFIGFSPRPRQQAKANQTDMRIGADPIAVRRPENCCTTGTQDSVDFRQGLMNILKVFQKAIGHDMIKAGISKWQHLRTGGPDFNI